MGKSILFLSMVLVASLIFTTSCVSKEVQVTETFYETEYRTEYKTESYTTTEDVVVETVEGWDSLRPKTEWRTNWVYLIDSSSEFTNYHGYDISTQGEHSKSQIQVTFVMQPQLHKGIIYAVDLTDAYSDQSIPFSGLLFGKEPTQHSEGGQLFVPDEGCQIIDPQVLGDVKVWVDGFNAVMRNSARILGRLPVDKETTDYSITFDAKDVKDFAVVIGVKPENVPFNVKLNWSDDIVEQRTVTKEREVPYQVPVEVEKQRTVTKTEKVPFWEAMMAGETPSTTTEAPSASPEPVSTNTTLEAEPPASPDVTPEVEPTATSSTLLYEDDFSDPKSGAVEQSTPQGESYYKDGEFHGVLNLWDWSSWQYRRNAGRFKDFIIEEDIRLVSGPKNSSYGLIFRGQDDDNFYRFLVSENGNYVVGARINGQWVDMPRWMMSEYVEKGYSTNHLKVVCKGTQIEVYVNGHHLTTVEDDSFADGYIGGIIYTPEPGAHVAFDNLKVYSLAPETQ